MAECELCGQGLPMPVVLPTEVIIDESGWYIRRDDKPVIVMVNLFNSVQYDGRCCTGYATLKGGGSYSWYENGVWVESRYPNSMDIVRKATPEEAAELNEKYINNEVRPAN